MVAPVTRQQTAPHDDSVSPSTAGPLATLDADARAALRGVAHRLCRARGAHVWRPTDLSDAVYLVVEGDARIISVAGRGREATVAVLRSGDVFGLSGAEQAILSATYATVVMSHPEV